MNFAGGAVVLIFTVERFNSAVHHRETHSYVPVFYPLQARWYAGSSHTASKE
nr:MAG TPA_asm: hypothetical protein [Caudoviricetes sp.]